MADGNVKLTLDYLTRSAHHLADEHVAGVIGKVKMWDTKNAISKYRSLIWTLRYNNHKRIMREINAGMILPRMFSKKAFDAVGGFNPDAGWAIDIFLTQEFLKQGYKLVYDPEAIWWHKWRDTPRVLLRYNYKFGKLNADIDIHRKRQIIKNSYFLLLYPIIVAAFFNVSLLSILLLHPLPMLYQSITTYLRAKHLEHRPYAFIGPFLSYLQNIPYALGAVHGTYLLLRRKLKKNAS